MYFLRDFLQNTAEDEIRHRNPGTPDELFEILNSVFGSHASRPQCLREFYNRIQRNSETV